MNYVNFPLILPFKFVPATDTPGIFFDDKWACEQIRSWERRTYYDQKWVKTDITPLQIESTIAPNDMIIYDKAGNQVKTLEWSVVFSAINYKLYQLNFDISDLPDGRYWIYQRVTLLSFDYAVISEPIYSKTSWPNTMLFRYKNSFNDFDIAWTTGIQMMFRCEAAIMDPEFKRERTDYVNQILDTATLKATPHREMILYVGEAPGVAPWVADLMNRIFCCDYINAEGLLIQAKAGAEGKTNRIKGNPMVGWSQDVVPAKNMQSLQFADTTPLTPGIVIAYDMETAFFGPGSIVPVTDVETNS